VDFAFTAEQRELREMARAFLAERSDSQQVRAAMESALGFDPQTWKRIGAELGWPAAAIPESYGGAGMGAVELCALMEPMGEALLCAPFFASACLAASALLACGSEAQKRAHLPGIASGECIAALGFSSDSGHWDADAVQLHFRQDGGDAILSGTLRCVDGHCADLLLLAARAEGSRGAEGISLFAVPADAKGIARERLPTMDATRCLAALRLDEVRVPASARLGEAEFAWPGLERALQHAAVALAAEQVGGAARCLQLAVAHAKQRVQFGKPIGAFQALKHKMADMMVQVETARSATYYAACVADDDAAALPAASAMAKAAASDAYTFCAGQALQIFGGVGFTWEYDLHLYFKRARSSAVLLGDSAWHRERLAQCIGL